MGEGLSGEWGGDLDSTMIRAVKMDCFVVFASLKLPCNDGVGKRFAFDSLS